MNSKPEFFLGANSDKDFVSYFRGLQEQYGSMQLFILKGGPGSGKSTLMRRVMKFAEEKGHNLEVIPCASDPFSLDAFIDYTAGFSMMDGTSPHTEDPILPGARQHIMYTGDLWDIKKLAENSTDIEKVTKAVADCHKGAGAYIKAASSLLKENRRYAEKFLLREKAVSLAEDILKRVNGGKEGKTFFRLLSAVSVGEIKVMKDTPYHYGGNIIALCDPWGAAADFILKTISFGAKLKGENFIYCPCSIMPEKCDHLIFPDSQTSVVTQNRFLDFGGSSCYRDFYDSSMCEEDMKAREEDARRLLSEACSYVKKAKETHDELEHFYKTAMDFGKTDHLLSKIISEFYSQI